MIADLDESGPDAPDGLPEYDLCVVGSGPAGATLARELVNSGLRVAVLESGRRRPTRYGDELREVESTGIHVKAYSRERVLGGASTTWAGLSSPLDKIDMGPRPWVNSEGWPIARDELFGYYGLAGQRYRFPDLEDFGPDGIRKLRDEGALQPEWEVLDEKVFLAASEPQNFGKEWTETYEDSGVDLWLDASVVELAGPRDKVEFARIRTRSGREYRLRASAFVLATGGIENARLLLVSRDAAGTGLGNDHDQVGRYFMNHPKNYGGIIRFKSDVGDLPYFFGCLHRGFAGYGGLRLREDEQRKRKLLNSYVRLEPIFPWTDSEGVESLVTLVKRSGSFFKSWKRRRTEEVVTLRDYSETGDDNERQNEGRGPLAMLKHLVTVVLHLPSVSKYLFYRLSRVRPRIRTARLRNFMEMEPNPENRVVLDERSDRHGTPLARVVHAPTTTDRQSLLDLHAAIETELIRTGAGSLEGRLENADPWPIDQDASHHMGTTRMGLDPRTSVVDTDLRVHGVENLYCAGASVFPTSGCANPTFTIVALSIRLAEHLADELGKTPREVTA